MTTTIYIYSEKRTKSFLNKSHKIHNGKYDYSLVKYLNNRTNVKIICHTHGIFEQLPTHHIGGSGCPKCSKNIKHTTDTFIFLAKSTHGDMYDYSLVSYINAKIKIEIICNKHGTFWQNPNLHLKGNGCPKCFGNIKSTTKEFTNRASIEHNKKYDYTKVDYINAHTKVEIICNKHGSFFQKPNNHLNGQGCPRCKVYSYSKISIEWLNLFNLDIQHAENGGEYHIPNTRYSVDGYCKETNTVYEFHGDVYHGNPDLFSPDERCHPYNKNVTAHELYQNTIERENDIISLGYNLITIWENDFNNYNKTII